MAQTTWRTAFTGSLAAAALSLCAASAHAGWGSSGGSWGGGGSSGGWSGWGSSGGGSWGGSRGWGHHGWRRSGWGSSGGWGGWGSGGGWGSSGGWGRSYGSSGGSWGGGGWGSSGGYAGYGSYGGSAGAAGMTYYGPAETRVEKTPGEPTPADKVAPPEKPSESPPPPDAKAAPGPTEEKKAAYESADSTILTVSVPHDAKVFVNGKETTTPGAERQFISRNLVPGYRYAYRVRAEVTRDGEPVIETKVVEVQTGESARVDFNLGESVAKKKAPTKLTVHVPADAKLYLAGRETRSTGATRTFRTALLDSDGTWENYTIRAIAQQDGRMVTKEKTITLHAGEHQEVTFDFDSAAPTLAAATGEAVR